MPASTSADIALPDTVSSMAAPTAPTAPTVTAATSDSRAAPGPAETLLLTALSRIDLTSADGRAGIRCLLAELDRLAPAALLRQAAMLDLRRMGCAVGPDVRAR